VLILDEADRMLDMGFIEDINNIIEKLPAERQNLLFSATLSKQVRALAKTAVNHAVEIDISKDKAAAPAIAQWLTTVDKDKKSALLSFLIKEQAWDQALIFIQTKHGAAKLVSQLEKRDIKAEAFHSGRSQVVREQVLAEFKSGKLRFLVATGVASRGIDIDALTRVVNYDLPDEADDYIHRIGRTGRAGEQGEALSFVSKDDFKNLCAIERRLGHIIERKAFPGFEPKKSVPISILDFVPKHKPAKVSSPRSNGAAPFARTKEGTFEAAKAKQHRSAKPRPPLTTEKTENPANKGARRPKPATPAAQGESSQPFNPWLSGPKST
ncbi:MAG: helicase-related protein, partial [Shewanella sp.]